MKRIDLATYEAAKAVVNGTFEGGVISYGIKEGGVDYAPSSHENVPPEILTYVDEMKAKVIEGTIIVPSTYEEFENF
jgi:basic membrane protein A